jgi:transcriptional regulator with XRE-family HTH domain
VSAATLSRVERGYDAVDLRVLQRLSAWLGRPIVINPGILESCACGADLVGGFCTDDECPTLRGCS